MTYTHPISYWQSTLNGAVVEGDSLPRTADVVVVGGGVLGAATTLWLARSGVQVVLLEREALAAGASGRNGGLIVPGTAEAYPAAIERHGHTTAQAVWSLTVEGLAFLDELLAEEGLDCDHRKVGHISLAIDEGQYIYLARIVEHLWADGFAAELLDRQQVQELVHTPLGPQIVGGKWLPEGRAVHSGRFVASMVAAARRHGAMLSTGTLVKEIVPEAGGLRIETNKGILQAGAAVVALNAWAPQLLSALSGLITPVRGQVLAYEPLPTAFPVPMGVSITPTGEYWQQTLDGSIVIGGCRALAADRDVANTEVATSFVVQTGIEQVLPGLFPELGPLEVARRWAGTMGFTADYLPLAGQVGELPVWYAAMACPLLFPWDAC
jgi:gamma-glutamylputrescine oxidase